MRVPLLVQRVYLCETVVLVFPEPPAMCTMPGGRLLLEWWGQILLGRQVYTPGIQHAENIRKVAAGHHPDSLPEAHIDTSKHDEFIRESEQRVADHRAAMDELDRQLGPIKKAITSGKATKKTAEGLKQEALSLLKARSRHLRTIKQIEARIGQAQVLKDTILNAKDNTEYVNLVASSKTMLSQHAAAGAVKEIDNLMLDLGEGVKAAEELSAAISQPFEGGQVEDLESMLDDFLAAGDDEYAAEEDPDPQYVGARKVVSAVRNLVPPAEEMALDSLPQVPAAAHVARQPKPPEKKLLPASYTQM